MPALQLHIGAEHTTLVRDTGKGPEAVLRLTVGSRNIAGHFRQPLPTPQEMEAAIVTVENEIMRTRTEITDNAGLFTTDPVIHEIAHLAGVTGPGDLLLGSEAMERVFARLAAVAQGRPPASEDLPENRDLAATLLILRECMQHLKFPAIQLRPATEQST